jgi:YHS domain-containing protein
MFRKKLIAVMTAAVIGMAMYGGSGSAFAHEGHDHDVAASPAGSDEAAKKGKLCPVSGEEIDQPGKYTYEYKGKVYNLCSAGCVEEFKKDPEKYIRKMKEDAAKLKGHDHRDM